MIHSRDRRKKHVGKLHFYLLHKDLAVRTGKGVLQKQTAPRT